MGDERFLLPAEAAPLHDAVLKVRRQSGAARVAARSLLHKLDFDDVALPRSSGGEAEWPAGIVGSMAHDDAVAVAAVARRDVIAAVGIDVEPAIPLPAGLETVIATPRERARYDSDLIRSRLLFSLKEAVYKAQYPLDGAVLDFCDVEIDLPSLTAITSTGRRIKLRFITTPRIFTLAYVPAAASI